MNVVIYSILTNDYDIPNDVTLSQYKHILFTDNPNIIAHGWEIVEIEKTNDSRLQRQIKILGHERLQEFDVTVYVDANIVLNKNFDSLIRQYRGGFYAGQHERKCVYQEGLAVKKLNKANPDDVDNHIMEYYKSGFPTNFGMWSTGVMIRDRSTKELCKIWHDELSKHTHRDQLSLPRAVFETGIKVTEFRMLTFCQIKKHKIKEPPRVVYLSPHRADINIGKAYNDDIELVPDDAWIVITDSDACFLNPHDKNKIPKLIMDFGNDYDLIGCLTNRIGSNHQCYEGKFSNEMNLMRHKEIAMQDLPHEIVPGGVAGFFMLFSKETWNKVGGFKEKTIATDTAFNRLVEGAGGRCGVYQGIVMLHGYRLGESKQMEARKSINHLK